MMMGTAIINSMTYTTTAFADKDDTFNFTAGSVYMYDSNLFRAPAGFNQPNPEAERSDSILKTNIGISIDKDYSLQKFKFDYWHEETRFNNNDFLNFNGNNYYGAWLWAITPNLKGTLSSKRTVDLVPFIDFQTATRNIRTTEFQNFDFDYSPHNKWHLLGGVSKLDVENSQVFIQEQSFKFKGVEAGVKYTFPSESFFKFMVRRRDGDQAAIPSLLVSDGFKEDEQELSMFWLVSGKSRIVSNLGHLKREDNDFSVRDFSGWFGGINYAWDITGKLNLTVDLSRRIAAFQDTFSSYTTMDALTVKPTWAVTSKIKVSANAQYGHRKFLNDGVQENFGRNDDMVSYGVSADWTPRDTMKFGVNLRHEERDSTAPNRDYSADIASISGQLLF